MAIGLGHLLQKECEERRGTWLNEEEQWRRDCKLPFQIENCPCISKVRKFLEASAKNRDAEKELEKGEERKLCTPI